MSKRGQAWTKAGKLRVVDTPPSLSCAVTLSRATSFQGQSPTTELRAKKLNPGDEYVFRVAAVNPEGQGPWQELKQPIKATDPYGDKTICLLCLLYLLQLNITITTSAAFLQNN